MNQDLVIVEPVIEDARSAADCGLGVAEHIPGETEPGRNLNRRCISQVLLHNGHTLERSHCRSKLPDYRRRQLLAADGIAAHADTRGIAERLDQLRLLSA